MKILPIHPQPRDGEILSCWMVRLALSNYFQLHTFYSKVLNYKEQIWTRDVDRNPAQDLLELLSSCSGVPLPRLSSMLLSRFDGTLYENVRMHGTAKWIMPLGVYHRTHRRQGMQFCPKCLADELPYYRLSWRISFFTICEIHHCFLIESCPKCKANVAYHRLGVAREEFVSSMKLNICHCCAFNLAHSPVIYPKGLPENVVDDYLELLHAISTNLWGSLSLPAGHPLAFFDGIKALLSVINRRSMPGLREFINWQFPINLPVIKSQLAEFGYLSVEERFKLIATVLWLLHDWPNRIVKIFLSVQLTRSRFTEIPNDLPFWLLSMLNERLDFRPYVPSSEEFWSVREYLLKRGLHLSVANVAGEMGIGEDLARSLRQCWDNSFDS